MSPFPSRLNRRDFLRQTFAFSALAAMAPGAALQGQAPGLAGAVQNAPPPDPNGQHMFMIGDWGTDRYLDQQISVANAMKRWVDERHIHPGALFMLGDNWYGDMGVGYASPRWQKQFEQMYPTSHFPGPAYAVLGNHDYEHKISNKVDLQLGYANQFKGTRWTMPGHWYSFTYPKENPV
ncbi:MAG TPA: metallophosphoesterase, partial [Acidobacteriaceae bacterium]